MGAMSLITALDRDGADRPLLLVPLLAAGALLSCSAVICVCLNDAHAQPDEIAVDWIVEGQPVAPVNQGGRDGFVPMDNLHGGDGNDGDDGIQATNHMIIAEPIFENSDEFKYDRFVTGNEYAMGDHSIFIFSSEGQLLNQAIIDQRDLQQDSFRHKIKYHDRFSDGYVELAEALLDPIGEQTYYIGGAKYDHNINSNLEIFVLERGYSLDNLQAVPNYIFSPMEFTLGRALVEDASRTGAGTGDLRTYSPNHMEFDDETLDARMRQSFAEQTSEILGQVLFAPPEPIQEPDLYTLTAPPPTPSAVVIRDADAQSKPQPAESVVDMFNDMTLLSSGQQRFEDAGRVADAVERRSEEYVTANAQIQERASLDTNLLPDATALYVLLIVSTAAGLVAFGYVMWQMRQTAGRGNLDAVAPLTHNTGQSALLADDYIEHVRTLLCDAQRLYGCKQYKKAHESLGRAVRLFYSYRDGAHQKEYLTNEDLLARMQVWAAKDNDTSDNIQEYESVREWLAICGSVAYARHKPDKKGFYNVLEAFSAVVGAAGTTD